MVKMIIPTIFMPEYGYVENQSCLLSFEHAELMSVINITVEKLNNYINLLFLW